MALLTREKKVLDTQQSFLSQVIFYLITLLYYEDTYTHTRARTHVYIYIFPDKFEEKLVKFYIWSISLYGAENWTLPAVDHKHLESFEMWCWRKMEKISWTDQVRNEEVLIRASNRGISYMK